MEEKEYEFTVRVIHKTDDKIGPLDKEPKVTRCLLNKNDLLIKTEQPIRIPFASIHKWRCFYERPPVFNVSLPKEIQLVEYDAEGKPLGTSLLTYFDDLNKKQQLSLEMATSDLTNLNETLRAAVLKARKQAWKAIVAGVLDIISGAFQLLVAGYFGIMLLTVLYPPRVEAWPIDLLFITLTLSALLAIIGGKYNLQRTKWRLAMAGSIAASLPAVGALAFIGFTVASRPPGIILTLLFIVPSVLIIAAPVLTALSKEEFE